MSLKYKGLWWYEKKPHPTKGRALSLDHRKIISGLAKQRTAEKNPNWRGGRIRVECSYCNKEKMVARYRGLQNKNHFCNTVCYGKYQESPVKNLNKKLRDTHKYKVWSRAVRDLFEGRCARCWEFKKIEAHHLIPFRSYVARHRTVDDAKKDASMWSDLNGIPLCFDCHSKIDSYRLNFKKHAL